MKIFYISDNRDAPNWGCRATSEALERLIKSAAGGNCEIRNVGVMDIHLIRPYSPFTKSRKVLNLVEKILFSRKSPTKVKRVIAKCIYYILYPLFHRPFLHQDSVPSSVAELDLYLDLFKAGETLDKERRNMEWADVVIANGEGAFYQDERKGKYILFLLYAAKVLYKKPVILANHMFDVKSDNLMSLCKKVYPLLDDIIFRDFMSLELFRNNVPNVLADAAPDAAFSYNPTGKEFSNYLMKNPRLMDSYYGHANDWTSIKKPFILLGGSSIINKPFFVQNYDAVGNFTKLVEAYKKANINVVICVACEGDSFLEQVAITTGTPLIAVEIPTQLMVDFYSECSCFISGRYHPMILASVSGTPTIIFDSNSHKTISLRNLLGMAEQPIFELKDLVENIPAIVKQTQHIIDNEPEFRSRILGNVATIRSDTQKHTASIKRLANQH